MSILKKLMTPLAFAAVVMCLDSCSSTKNVAYFQNAQTVNLDASKTLYDARIMPKDILTITVSTVGDDAAVPFNLTVPTPFTQGQRSAYSQAMLQSYLVDNEGNINFPVVGSIHVGGLTKTECQDLIVEKIKPYLAESEKPIVTVRMSSYHVTVIGEVNKAAVIPVTTEKMSIIEALAEAGDLTIYGKRDNVVLIREGATGKKEYHRINLNDANLFASPYYYLQQNDIIYVEPNGVKAKSSGIGTSTTIWFSFVGIVTSVASLLVNILRN